MEEQVVPSDGFGNEEKSFVYHYLRYQNVWHRIELHLLRCGSDRYNDEAIAYFHPTPHFNRIFILRSGKINLRSADGEITIAKDRVYLLPINQSFTASYEMGTQLIFAHFKVQDSTGLDFFRDVTGFPSLRSSEFFADEIARNIDLASVETYFGWQSAVIHCIFLLLADLSDFSHKRHNVPDRFVEVVRFIQENCRPTLTIDELAVVANSSRSALSKGFQRSMGVSLKKYIHEMIVAKAKELLATTDLNVQETAFELGYRDPYYFQRFFKRNTGETPLHFKKAVQNHSN